MAACLSRRNLMKARADWLLISHCQFKSIAAHYNQLVIFVMHRNHSNQDSKLKHYKRKAVKQEEEGERFSSFETPPPSDQENEDLSDFETSREKGGKRDSGQHSLRKKRKHIVIEELPLQRQKSHHFNKKSEMELKGQTPICEQQVQKCEKKAGTVLLRWPESPKLKENCAMRFNYMQKIERHLSTIQQQGREQARDSAHRPPHRAAKYQPSKLSAFDCHPLNTSNGQRIYYQTNISLMQQQQLEMLILEQENISLKERVMILEKELRVKDENSQRREAQLVQRISAGTEDCLNSARKQAKNKLMEEVGILQSKCREMREEMRLYKQRQEESVKKLLAEKESVKVENIMLKTVNQCHAKFTEVFLNMVEKLPIEIDPAWSKKRKIAVGWKVVKHFVKKAMKLGIPPPSISHKHLL